MVDRREVIGVVAVFSEAESGERVWEGFADVVMVDGAQQHLRFHDQDKRRLDLGAKLSIEPIDSLTPKPAARRKRKTPLHTR